MQDKTFTFYFVIFTFIGFSAWAFSEKLSGKIEPWDGYLYHVINFAAVGLGMLSRHRKVNLFWGTFLGMWMGQLIATTCIPHLQMGHWLLLGIITTGIWGFITGACVMFGVALRLLLKTHFKKEPNP